MPTLEEKIDKLTDMMLAFAKNSLQPAQYDNFLVGGGVQKPKPPTGPEVAADPGKYYGTNFDPLQSVVGSRAVVINFATPGKEEDFILGAVTEWSKKDRSAFDRWFLANFGAPLNYDRLHPAQRAAMDI